MSLAQDCPSFERQDPLAATRPEAAEQRTLIQTALDDTVLAVGDSWFLVAYKWWEFWCDHVNFRQIEGAPFGPQPLEIENHDLLDENDHTRVRFGAQNESDYTLVPSKVWKYVHNFYLSFFFNSHFFPL
ncbi:MAG: DUSP domain-containing protein [archaeon]|nr:DUSP domain-containing protein [archaeon]